VTQDVPDFGWETSDYGGKVVLAVRGEVDISTSPKLGEGIRRQLRSNPVLLDLSGLSFMDSSGVRVIDAAVRDAHEEGQTLTIGSALPNNVRLVFDLTGLTEVLTFEDLPDQQERDDGD
jgi:anti-sigma B factor antagonist